MKFHNNRICLKCQFADTLPISLIQPPCRSPNLTPLFSGGTFRARFLKFMPALSRPLQHGVKHIAQLYHDFMLDFQHGFNCFHESAFDSFTLYILHKFLIVVKHFYFYSSLSSFLQWGETFELPRFVICKNYFHPKFIHRNLFETYTKLFLFLKIFFLRRAFIDAALFSRRTHTFR